MKFLYAIALAGVALACNSAIIDSPQRYGTISVALGSPDVEVVTKTETLTPSSDGASDYTVSIFNTGNDTASVYSDTFDNFTEPKVLPFGTYYVTVENCPKSHAESTTVTETTTAGPVYGKMRLYGRTTNDIELKASNLSAEATVNCTVANAKVSVQFDQSLGNYFTDLTVGLHGGTTLTSPINISKTSSDVITSAWFNPSELTYTISGTFVSGSVSKPIYISKSIDLEAKNNVKLVIKVSLENGQISLNPTVTIDTSVVEPTEDNGGLIEEEFNPYE